MINKNKYIIISPLFPTNEGHVGSYVYDQAKTLSDITNYDVRVIKVVSMFSNEKDYTFIKHIHKGWLQKILGKQIPLLTSWNSINSLKQLRPDLADTDEFKEEVNKYEDVINYMVLSDDFPDHGHPGRKLHKKLAEEIEPYV